MAQSTKVIVAIVIVAVLIVAAISAYAILALSEDEEPFSTEAIVIQSDSELESSEFVSGGAGTASDPYIISDLSISLSRKVKQDYPREGILMHHIDAYFVIRNVTARTDYDYRSKHDLGFSGIVFSTVGNGTVESCRFENLTAGITISNSTVSIINNTFETCFQGVRMESPVPLSEDRSDIVLVQGNNFKNTEYCILAFGESPKQVRSVWIMSNSFSDYGEGIRVDDCSEFTIMGNLFGPGWSYAVRAIKLNHSSITYNTLEYYLHHGGGFYLSDCNNITIDSNTIDSVEVALDIVSSRNINVTHNHISGRILWAGYGGLGVFIEDSHSVNFTWNVIAYNAVGLMLISSDLGGSSVLVHHNSFLSNAAQAIDNSGSQNHWDDGMSAGNYWDDYNGVDNNHDGIGDTPYVIDGDITDDYPLMVQPEL